MLTTSDRSLLLRLAREQIQAKLEGRSPLLPGATPGVSIRSGAFVTLHKRTDKVRSLRGCIGHLEAVGTLYETVKSVALSAAFDDYRFPSLSADEFPSVDLEISVLSPFARIDDPEDVKPGVHGILVRRGSRSGLLLPQVAIERNWDRETFLSQTCVKAGLPEDAWRAPDTEIQIFSAEVFGEEPSDDGLAGKTAIDKPPASS